MLRSKLFRAFAALVLLFGLVSILIGQWMIKSRVVEEAQSSVRSDLAMATAECNFEMREIELTLRLTAGKKRVADACAAKSWADPQLDAILQEAHRDYGLDFVGLVAPDGRVVLRATSHKTGDYQLVGPVISAALKGRPSTAWQVYSPEHLALEAADLPEQSFMVLEETPHARPTPKKEEARGMVMVGACPVRQGAEVTGVVYGGVLLNRNAALVDRIQDILYRDKPRGTVTLFLKDIRIATTVRLQNGNRAIGTRASKEVADRVLDNGKSWTGRAFVVNDYYLTQYNPIRDPEGQVIGMLYVGVLERPFRELSRRIVFQYGALSVFGLLLSLVIAFFFARRLARPIQNLVGAADAMQKGHHPEPVPIDETFNETRQLIVSFNEMARTLAEREKSLTEANASLKSLNRSYMETLGFVSHELKSPLQTIVNYVYLLLTKKIGPLTEKQEKSVRNIRESVNRLVEMIRHYLNLSRIENGELAPVRTRLAVREEVLNRLEETYDEDMAARKMKLEDHIGDDVVIHADLNMTREVFENMISNALKYGREGGTISLSCKRTDAFYDFAVRNEGEGIPPDKINTLFQKFSRLEDQQATRKEKGTGLGLFIVKNIIEAHGGRIEVASEWHQGVEFRFTLPVYVEKTE